MLVSAVAKLGHIAYTREWESLDADLAEVPLRFGLVAPTPADRVETSTTRRLRSTDSRMDGMRAG